MFSNRTHSALFNKVILLSCLMFLVSLACLSNSTSSVVQPPAPNPAAVTALPTFIILPTPTATVMVCNPPKLAPNASGYIKKITLATDVKKETLGPVNKVKTYAPSDTVHIVTALGNVPSHTLFKAIWYANNVPDPKGVDAPACNLKLDEYTIEAKGTGNLDFTFKPTESFPKGAYRLEIYVNGVLDTVVNFTVA